MLTEEALLKQPPEKYMDDEQLEFFKSLLLKQKMELVNSLKETNTNLQTQEREADENDRASLEEERWLELRIREREGKLISKIDEALHRIEDGSYGYCDETGEEIGVQRLLIRPTATLSIEAKQRRENIEKAYSDG
ncbi:MAG TPA: RNA polymerase-binding protein DksA [Gammaproteobacteria bacterium]|nr:RNA polymerase-binding protein DksA [Gammaproteobacteria bacterium]